PNCPPANMLAEKNVNPNITVIVFAKELRFDCGTVCNENSVSVFFMLFPPISMGYQKAQKKRLIIRLHLTISLFSNTENSRTAALVHTSFLFLSASLSVSLG